MEQTKTAGSVPAPVEIDELIARTLRVPLPTSLGAGDGEGLTAQLDAALMRSGFKLSAELFMRLASSDAAAVSALAVPIVEAAKRLVGAHRRHNPYFIDFPKNVPDTEEFWQDCLRDALEDPAAEVKLTPDGRINLLSLPRYGRYQHSYEDLLAAHARYVEQISDRVTVLRLGQSPRDELLRLYHQLAGSPVPLTVEDSELVSRLARMHTAVEEQPAEIPVRETRTLINVARIDTGVLLVTDLTDVLRLARALSGAPLDVPLSEPVPFRSFPRRQRRTLLHALDTLAMRSPQKLADVLQYTEQWKRLGERLHPHEYGGPAVLIFRVARREMPPPVASVSSRYEQYRVEQGPEAAARLLASAAPGRLMRSADHLLRSASTSDEEQKILDAIASAAPDAARRVLLSLREHCDNRRVLRQIRLFVNQSGRGKATEDTRSPLSPRALQDLRVLLDGAIQDKLPRASAVIVQKDAGRLALPLSGKGRPNGLGVLPRGSVVPVRGSLLRYFIYWREHEYRTDYDLSTIFLDQDYQPRGQVSYTNLRSGAFTHSGDLTESRGGATEFVDADLGSVDPAISFVVPQINVYSGESFDQVEEAFAGFMEREPESEGRPFEARTVRAKSDISGRGKVALPLLLQRSEDGWEAKWMHMVLSGHMWGNATENNKVPTSVLARAIAERKYLTVSYLAGLIVRDPHAPVLYIGLDDVNAPDGSRVVTPSNLGELLV